MTDHVKTAPVDGTRNLETQLVEFAQVSYPSVSFSLMLLSYVECDRDYFIKYHADGKTHSKEGSGTGEDCEFCAAGEYSTDGEPCRMCPRGYTSAKRRTECISRSAMLLRKIRHGSYLRCQ